VWIPELRGHGLSPKDENFSNITAQDQILHDLPAIQEYVFQITGEPAFWIGHSTGGLDIIAALSMQWLDQEKVKGMVTFGSQISLGDTYLKIPPVAWIISLILKMIGYFPAPKFGLGPEIEPAGVILETIRWKKLFGKWTDSKGKSYWDGLNDICVPVMSFAAAKDKNDPAQGCKIIHDQCGSRDKIFIILERNYRFSKDYDHVGMVVSKDAQTEVWPDVAGWMRDRS
jgi:pimeloyl-ACP methyl ester carboxylesterase